MKLYLIFILALIVSVALCNEELVANEEVVGSAGKVNAYDFLFYVM